ncbi:dipeptidase PepE [Flavobacteriaceae bacterium]|nr:dipeptidase PepE [Flavobacteriaceae bacterium]
MKEMIIASTSTIHGSEYLEYLLDEIDQLYNNIEEIVFIPYARPSGISHDEYTDLVENALTPLGICVRGLHEFENPIEGLTQAKGIFTGGGNTFLLVKMLYDLGLMSVLNNRVEAGTPYLGTSAGSNITGLNMKTTNDMPIVYPPSFNTTGLIPFNINAHYLDPDPSSTHKGETRETRIKEFHKFNKQTVIGLREGSWLSVKGNEIKLKGSLSARVFEQEKKPYELAVNSVINS